ncbi:MAG: hypothetical protein RMJ05_13980 [Thermomicrobium sp.]|nr:hypothetical protein [Thermomicrobium sp.]
MRISALPLRLVTLLILVVVGIHPLSVGASDSPPTGRWFRIETHMHSVFSSDAVADVGVLTAAARELGYDAVFLTDHNEGSAFQIEGETANLRTLDEQDSGWKVERSRTPEGTIAQFEHTTAFRGVRAFHVALPASGSLSLWTRRGPLVAAGPITFTFAVLVRRLEPGTGLAAMVSLGGAPDLGETVGYTTETGAVRRDHSVTLAWTIGEPLLPAATPRHRILAFSLPEPDRETWTVFTVDVSEALRQLPSDERPHRFAALLYPRFRLTATGGVADLFLDAVRLEAKRPLTPAEEFVARTSLCRAYSDESFQLFCAHEMGQQRHTSRFDYAITDTTQFRSFQFGTDGIPLVQQGGYPTQLNHPGSTIRIREILDHRAYGADFLEVRKPEWAAVWDDLLQRGEVILGTWGTDSHELIDRGNPATVVYAEALTLDTIVRALYEGRSFLARNTFTGTILLSPWPDPRIPYPARYPVFVSDRASAMPVFLRFIGDVPPGSSIRWIRNGQPFSLQPVVGPHADLVVEIPLEGTLTVVRAELLAPHGSVIALTQPLSFRDVPGMPSDYRIAISSIETPTGRGFNRLLTPGIVDAAWDSELEALLLTLRVPSGSRLSLLLETDRPFALELAGLPIRLPEGSSTLVIVQPTSVADLVISFALHPARIERSPPAPPSDLTAEPTVDGVSLHWRPSPTHDRPLRYSIERDGIFLTSVGSSTSFKDRSVLPGIRYRYTIRAVDLGRLTSPPTPPLTVTVPSPMSIIADFESGIPSDWTVTGDITIQEGSGHAHNKVARFDLGRQPTALQRSIDISLDPLSVYFRFQLLNQEWDTLSLLTLTDRMNRTITSLRIARDGRVILIGSSTVMSHTTVIFGAWYQCLLRLNQDGSSSVICKGDNSEINDITLYSPGMTFLRHTTSIIFGHPQGMPRAIFLIDDILIRMSADVRNHRNHSWAWGISRGRA